MPSCVQGPVIAPPVPPVLPVPEDAGVAVGPAAWPEALEACVVLTAGMTETPEGSEADEVASTTEEDRVELAALAAAELDADEPDGLEPPPAVTVENPALEDGSIRVLVALEALPSPEAAVPPPELDPAVADEPGAGALPDEPGPVPSATAPLGKQFVP